MTEEKHRFPNTTMRLKLTAVRLSADGDMPLDEEEHEMMPHLYRSQDTESGEERQLDQWWEIEVDEETGKLAPELDIEAWVNSYGDSYDGKTLTVHHDMPTHTDPTESYPTSQLAMGGEVEAQKNYDLGTAIYRVSLHISWPKQERKAVSLEQAFDELSQAAAKWSNYDDASYEIRTAIAYGPLVALEYVTYKPSQFPGRFFEDLREEQGLSYIAVQLYYLHEEWHSHSDDYIDAAKAHGEECDDWCTKAWCPSGEKQMYEIE